MQKKLSNKQLAVALYEATKGAKPSDVSKILSGYVKLLFRARKLSKAEYIINEFVKYAKRQEGIQQIEITAARELDEKIVAVIKKAFGAKTEAELKVDESLIGGVMIKTEDKILDASIKTQLNKLKQIIS